MKVALWQRITGWLASLSGSGGEAGQQDTQRIMEAATQEAMPQP